MTFLCNCLVKLAKNGGDESDISVEADSQGLSTPSSSAYVELLEHTKLDIFFMATLCHHAIAQFFHPNVYSILILKKILRSYCQ